MMNILFFLFFLGNLRIGGKFSPPRRRYLELIMAGITHKTGHDGHDNASTLYLEFILHFDFIGCGTVTVSVTKPDCYYY